MGDRTLFTVEGRGEFPYDMLRYDQCWPVSERQDSPQLASDQRGRRRITLATDKASAPTIKRWESFNWRVIATEK